MSKATIKRTIDDLQAQAQELAAGEELPDWARDRLERKCNSAAVTAAYWRDVFLTLQDVAGIEPTAQDRAEIEVLAQEAAELLRRECAAGLGDDWQHDQQHD
jgi:hypothetical protein